MLRLEHGFISVEIFFKGRSFRHHIKIDNKGAIRSNDTRFSHRIYDFLEKEIPLKDFEMIVVLRAQATEDPAVFRRIIKCYSMIESTYETKISKSLFFIEDLMKFHIKTKSRVEISLIQKILDVYPHENEIFHCERTGDLKYFDWYVTDQVLYIFDPIKEHINLNFENKICCLNSRFDQRRYIISSWLASRSESIDFSQFYSLPIDEVEKFSLIPDRYRHEIIKGAEVLNSRGGIKEIHLALPNLIDYISAPAVKELISRTQNSFCSLVTESRYDDGWPYFSEKTLRVLISGRPFLLLAPPNTLKLLRDLGVKTFSDYWDESYDTIVDPIERMARVIEQADMILQNPDLQSQLNSMELLLKHNQQISKLLPKKMLSIS